MSIEENSINIYMCQNRHEIITKDTKPRKVTPMFITCPTCKSQATSRGYNVDQKLKPTHEWFIPKTIEEYRDACVPIYGDVLTDDQYQSMIDDPISTPMYRKIK